MSMSLRHRWVIAGLAFALGLTLTVDARAKERTVSPRWEHLKTALYFTSGDVEHLLLTAEARRATLAHFAPLRVSKVYLEGSRQPNASSLPMAEIVSDLRSQGLEVAGAVVPAGPKGPLCYNDPADMALLEGRVRELAGVVDEIIVDDWLFTTCTCRRCVEARGTQTWADYRSHLLAERAKEHIIDAARKVHPGERLVIKYPNWYEGHRYNGYDVALQTPQFDGVSVGIETRQRATHDQHIPIYSGYVFQKWIGGFAGPKWASAWLDNYHMQGDDNDYVAQVWQAVLARAPEIIFWCAGQLHPPTPAADVYPHLRELMPAFDRVAGMLDGRARGIPIHLPIGSVGEYNVFGYFGMIGLPMEPVTSVPAGGPTTIFTLHSLRQEGLARLVLDRLEAGKNVLLTWPLLDALRQSELGNVVNVINEGAPVSSATFRFRETRYRYDTAQATHPIAFPRLEVSTWPGVRDIALVREDADFGVLLNEPYLDGRAYVLNLPDNTYDLLRLPTPVLDALREPFASDLGVRLMGPGGVALYLFGDRQCVLYNTRDQTAAVALRFAPGTPTSGWRERVHDKVLTVGEAALPSWWQSDPGTQPPPRPVDVSLTLDSFEIALVEAPTGIHLGASAE